MFYRRSVNASWDQPLSFFAPAKHGARFNHNFPPFASGVFSRFAVSTFYSRFDLHPSTCLFSSHTLSFFLHFFLSSIQFLFALQLFSTHLHLRTSRLSNTSFSITFSFQSPFFFLFFSSCILCFSKSKHLLLGVQMGVRPSHSG